ncbi:MAG: DUF4974 domain-containing protein [Winogradskyella sp.]|uniref:FecR family protein n=1 Tax=Winogradskyella sp. TaxID=1883156 RepID=UPI0017E44F68|nr:FecR domain-containing protein [Winogradskyella sp.]MBT8243972.1 FecR domain-containing protein [Winogradskyella sp.]NNK22332.1 DUF4974 domain-containing protein [Winogradskyella sp.]
MNREELIKKWLDHNLNPDEQKAFEGLEDYKDLIRLSESVEDFKSPNFDSEEVYAEIKSSLKPKTTKNWIRSLLRVAAALIIGFSLFYYNSTLDTQIETSIAQETTVSLPDASTVALNAQSTLTYNKKSWSDKREVLLNGEAFFKVAKGSKFDVITTDGKVSVLGTQFNVVQHDNYFEVTCFEGLVAVSYNSESIKLKPGNRFAIIDGVIKNELESLQKPSWLHSESSFKNRSLKHVLSELKRHYDVTIDASKIDVEELFTGTFTHKNLDLALQSITSPLGIAYTKSNSVIVLKSE